MCSDSASPPICVLLYGGRSSEGSSPAKIKASSLTDACSRPGRAHVLFFTCFKLIFGQV